MPLAMTGRLSRFDNRPSGLLSSKQACERLKVKPATLYTYVSRGLIRRVPGSNSKERLYLSEDVQRLASKAEARRGHRAVAVGALGFGDPVLDTQITSAGPQRLLYRGHDVLQLVQEELPFESVADLLWDSEPSDAWPRVKASVLKLQPSVPLPWRLAQLLGRLALADPDVRQHGSGQDVNRARTIVGAFAASLGSTRPKPGDIASKVAHGLGLPASSAASVNTGLVLVADHELNISTFAARVTASGGADLYACLGAALHAFSGPRHGGAPARIAALVEEVGHPKQARDKIRARLDRGDSVPGFGHPLYPAGDPRAQPLVDAALAQAGPQNNLRTLLAIRDVMEGLGQAMTVDGGLLALSYAWGLGPKAASAIFCVGRSAGWAAHVFEQRKTHALLRPTARYVGPVPHS